MELVEQNPFPGAFEILGGVGLLGNRFSQLREFFSGDQQILGFAVPLLDARMDGVAAACMVLQLVVHHRQRHLFVPQALEKARGRAEREGGQSRIPVKLADALQVLSCRPAAVIAHAVETRQLVEGRLDLRHAFAHVLV